MSDYLLDLRGVACPINFVRTKIMMDKMLTGEQLTLWLDSGEPVESVVSSVKAEGQSILLCQQDPAGYYQVVICKV